MATIEKPMNAVVYRAADLLLEHGEQHVLDAMDDLWDALPEDEEEDWQQDLPMFLSLSRRDALTLLHFVWAGFHAARDAAKQLA